jgi:hypothetical protein
MLLTGTAVDYQMYDGARCYTLTKMAKWLAIVSALLAACCAAPLLLYAAFGPQGGNPIGLGLLMVFGTPFFAGLAGLGLVIWVIGRLKDRKCNA